MNKGHLSVAEKQRTCPKGMVALNKGSAHAEPIFAANGVFIKRTFA